MKRVLLLSIVVILGGCLFNDALNFSLEDIEGKKNLLVNGSFEIIKDSLKVPFAWSSLDYGEKTLLLDDRKSFEGKNSLLIMKNKKNVSLISESFPIENDYAYYIKCFSKSENSKATKVMLNFISFDENGNKLGRFLEIKEVKKEWTLIELNSGFFSNKAKFARVLVEIPKDKKVWLDSIGVYRMYQYQYKRRN